MSDVYQTFLSQAVVRRAQVVDFLAGDHEKANAALRWLVASGKALRIKPGLYYFRNPDEWHLELVNVSPWLVAANAVEGSVIAYHSALKFHGYANSETQMVQIAVGLQKKRAPKKFTFQNMNYEFWRDDISFGITETVLGENKIKVMDKERLVLEGLNRPEKFFGMAEFLQSIEDIKWLDTDHLYAIFEKYARTSLSMRLGWLLERNREKWFVSQEFLDRLKKYRSDDRVFLVSNQRNGNILVKDWNLMMPKTLLAVV